MNTAKQMTKTVGWSVSPGVHDGAKIVTWQVCSAGGKMVAECESKTIADHIAKIHNRATSA